MTLLLEACCTQAGHQDRLVWALSHAWQGLLTMRPCDEDRVRVSGLPVGFTWRIQPHSLGKGCGWVQPACCSEGPSCESGGQAHSCRMAEQAPLLPPPARKISSLPPRVVTYRGRGLARSGWRDKSHLHHPWLLLAGSPDCSLVPLQLPSHGLGILSCLPN